MNFVPSPSRPRCSQDVQVGRMAPRRLFAEDTSTGPVAEGPAQRQLEAWRLIADLLGAGSEDGRRGALRLAADRQMPIGPALARLDPARRPSALSTAPADRQLLQDLTEAARREAAGRVFELELAVDRLQPGEARRLPHVVPSPSGRPQLEPPYPDASLPPEVP